LLLECSTVRTPGSAFHPLGQAPGLLVSFLGSELCSNLSRLRREFSLLRHELCRELSHLRRELSPLRRELSLLRHELCRELILLRCELRRELESELRSKLSVLGSALVLYLMYLEVNNISHDKSN
jgi:hypothetical protein